CRKRGSSSSTPYCSGHSAKSVLCEERVAAVCSGRSREVQMTVHRALWSAIAGMGLLAATAAADPQPWPTRAMQVISPFTAGNANDSVARVVLDPVSRQVGQPFVIRDKP